MNRDRWRARCSWEIEKRQKGQDRQEKEIEKNSESETERERMCAWRMDTTKRATQRETGRGGRRVWEKSMRKVGGKRVASERKSERGETKNEAWLHDWVSLTVGHTRESVLQTPLVIIPSRQLLVLCSSASGLVASHALQQNRSNADFTLEFRWLV